MNIGFTLYGYEFKFKIEIEKKNIAKKILQQIQTKHIYLLISYKSNHMKIFVAMQPCKAFVQSR